MTSVPGHTPKHQHYMFASFGSGKQVVQPHQHLHLQHRKVAGTDDAAHFGEQQVHRPHPNEILTVTNTVGKVQQSFPQVAELVESQYGVQLPSHLIVNNWQPPRPEGAVNYHAEGRMAMQSPAHSQQQLNHYSSSHPTQKVPLFTTALANASGRPSPVRNASTAKQGVQTQLQFARSVSNSQRESPAGSSITIQYQQQPSRKQSPLIIGSKAFDNLMVHGDNRQREQERGHAASTIEIQRHGSMKGLIDLNHQSSGAIHVQHSPAKQPTQKNVSKPPLPPSKPEVHPDQRKVRTEVNISIPSDNNRNIITNPESLLVHHMAPPTPVSNGPAAVSKPNNSYSHSPIKQSQPPAEDKRTPPRNPANDYTNFPTPMDLMRKESIESTKPQLPAFGLPQEAPGYRVASPISTLDGVASHVKQTVDDHYVSRGLAFFTSTAQNGIPQTTSITNSLQQNSREWASHSNQTLNVSGGSPAAHSIQSQGSLIKTPTFSVISQPEPVARNNVERISSEQPHESYWQNQGNRAQQFPQPFAQQRTETYPPAHQQQQNSLQQTTHQQQELQEQQPKARGIPATFRPNIVQAVTTLPPKKVTQENSQPLLIMVAAPEAPAIQPSQSLEDAFDILPIIEVLEYRPEKAVQVPEAGDICYYPQPNKELVDTSVQWESKIFRDLNHQTIDVSWQAPTENIQYIAPQIQSEEVVMRYQQVDQSLQVDLIGQQQSHQPMPQILPPIEYSNSETTVTSPTFAALPKTSTLEAGLRVIYGQEGTKKYEQFLRGVESRNRQVYVQQMHIAPAQPSFYAFRQATSFESLDTHPQGHHNFTIQRKSLSKDLTANTTATNNYEYDIARNYTYETVGKQPMTTINSIASEKVQEAFDRYAEQHGNQYVHDLPSWKELPDPQRQNHTASTATAVRSDTKTTQRIDTIIRLANELPTNHSARPSPFQQRSADPSTNYQQRSRSRTPLTNLPKLLSYDDLRQKLHQDESELLRYH